ncbi:MAG: shikimate dehydrogenase [Candidatus Omnitrophica bacterium CG_4_9_14_0_2_um_filter_42_8]|nr:MAG: shikimate dehydrogenase [Candidatus Omnitrophica bacterium CG22_combo_CG10-13_8_21_14_all_43_16]PJC47605.1 MAG: shikimate dehydrogenase [Candidatus Omnitrophica bacterium CG_4_9_14_0_2_um_filter_42_8]
MNIYGVIGWPIKHSLSPAMHNAAFKALGIDAEYRTFEIKPEGLGDFFADIDSCIKGLNVTIPHKEKVLDFIQLDQESFYLRQIKAVNTLVRQGKAWKGFNTDINGFSRHLKVLGFDPRGKKIAILGAGGASRAVSYELANKGAQEICIFDIDKDKASGVASMLKELFSNLPVKIANSVEELNILSKDALINATPIGLKESDPCLIDKKMIRKDLFVYDLIYNPAETKLLSLAKAAGASYSNGLGMLLYQGVLSLSKWTGRDNIPIQVVEVMRKALNAAIKQ